MEVVLQWSSGHSATVCSGFCLVLGLKLRLVHYYISGSLFYIKCHSLREFLMHAQVVYNAALFQKLDSRVSERKLSLVTLFRSESSFRSSVILYIGVSRLLLTPGDKRWIFVIVLNKGIIQWFLMARKISYLHIESSTVIWPPLLYFRSGPSLAVWVWVYQWVSNVRSIGPSHFNPQPIQWSLICFRFDLC